MSLIEHLEARNLTKKNMQIIHKGDSKYL